MTRLNERSKIVFSGANETKPGATDRKIRYRYSTRLGIVNIELMNLVEDHSSSLDRGNSLTSGQAVEVMFAPNRRGDAAGTHAEPVARWSLRHRCDSTRGSGRDEQSCGPMQFCIAS